MLSILIPTYNYNVSRLVDVLHKQATVNAIPFEIIVLDDASTLSYPQNQAINSLVNCTYRILEKNIGRSAIRNLLAKEAHYQWLLYLDADVIPIEDNFIKNYILQMNEPAVIYGGIRYTPEKPANNQLLRWIYGNSREALPVEKRKTNPYLSFLTLNFLMHKSLFEKVSFNETIPNLRHEDTLFSYNLMQQNITIIHIENPVYHLGIETSVDFLRKTGESIIGLDYLVSNHMISPEYTKLSLNYWSLKKIKFTFLIGFFFKMLEPIFKKNILGNRPSLFIFDLYRLGYYCKINP